MEERQSDKHRERERGEIDPEIGKKTDIRKRKRKRERERERERESVCVCKNKF